MSLHKYNEKRNFKETAEPKGKVEKSQSDLIFVIQKHAASHLHYDFRLEMDGVLKSWAVPKGPSLDPSIKRLAMMVEDHPYSYKDFEGSIPAGNYGAGRVIVWDNGTYIPADDYKGSAEAKLLADLKKGRLSFILNGSKLKGEFALIQLKGKQDNAWLLIKKDDKFARTIDILQKNKSILSKMTLESLEKKSAKKPETKKKTKIPKETETKESAEAFFSKPMLATATDKAFDNEEWIFEDKYDGYRTISVINEDKVELFSRNELSFTANFKAIAAELKKIEHTVVLDGEVVLKDENGKDNFQLLQNFIKTKKGILEYYVFDMLSLDGNDVTDLTLLERKQLLKMLLKKQQLSNIYYSDHVEGKGIQAFEKSTKELSEGIIAKKADSTYQIGNRSSDWLKIKNIQQGEAIIVGITEPKNSRSHFGALLLGQYDGENLNFIGKCGSGFTDALLKELHSKFKKDFVSETYLSEKPKMRDKIQWMKPKHVAQIKFTEWTQDNNLRHPVFLGLREDKSAEDVDKVKSVASTEILYTTKNPDNTMKNKNDYDLKVGKTILHLTNQNKVYFPKDGITKGDIVNYYDAVSEYILPYLKDRPQSMHRFPNGIDKPSFYQKDVDVEKIPNWLKTENIFSESNNATIDYLICNDKATLLYMANLGCIEINPWNSTTKKINNPNWIVIDIDPEKEEFTEVVKTALIVKEIMDELEADCYCKTSGATGLHVYIPLGAKHDYDTVKIFGELIAIEVQSRLPETTTLERSISKRNHKIYIDYLQNRKGQTLASVYSVRPKPGATVSTPLEWDEVNEKLSPSQFTIKNVIDRIKEKGDLWKPVLGKGADLNKIIKKLDEKKKKY